jgi:hypothetical protein
MPVHDKQVRENDADPVAKRHRSDAAAVECPADLSDTNEAAEMIDRLLERLAQAEEERDAANKELCRIAGIYDAAECRAAVHEVRMGRQPEDDSHPADEFLEIGSQYMFGDDSLVILCYNYYHEEDHDEEPYNREARPMTFEGTTLRNGEVWLKFAGTMGQRFMEKNKDLSSEERQNKLNQIVNEIPAVGGGRGIRPRVVKPETSQTYTPVELLGSDVTLYLRPYMVSPLGTNGYYDYRCVWKYDSACEELGRYKPESLDDRTAREAREAAECASVKQQGGTIVKLRSSEVMLKEGDDY